MKRLVKMFIVTLQYVSAYIIQGCPIQACEGYRLAPVNKKMPFGVRRHVPRIICSGLPFHANPLPLIRIDCADTMQQSFFNDPSKKPVHAEAPFSCQHEE